MKAYLSFLFIGILFCSCADDNLDASPMLINKDLNFIDKGKAFLSDDHTQAVSGTHSSWTHSNVAYDEEIDKVVVFYNVKNAHEMIHNKVAMRFKDTNDNFSDLIVVANRDDEGISCKAQSSGIAPNGDYLSFVSLFDNSTGAVIGTDVYRSKDKGKTWSSTNMLIDNKERVKAYSGDVTGFLVLNNGRILTLACDNITRLVRILYSDDNGITWHLAKTPICYKHTEPAWCELGDGTIICYLRSTVGNTYPNKEPAYFTRSFDGGLTWEEFRPSRSILNMTEANGHLVYNKKEKIIEFIHHSRFTEDDGFSSLFYSVASESDAKNDNMGQQIRVVRLPKQSPGDSGYVGATVDKRDDISIFYYSGAGRKADIYYMKKIKK